MRALFNIHCPLIMHISTIKVTALFIQKHPGTLIYSITIQITGNVRCFEHI